MREEARGHYVEDREKDRLLTGSGRLEFLRTLDAAEAKPENQRAFGQLLSTHPPFKERIARLTPIVESSAKNGKTLEARFTAALK